MTLAFRVSGTREENIGFGLRAHRAHQIVMYGPSLRSEKAPGKLKGVASPSRAR